MKTIFDNLSKAQKKLERLTLSYIIENIGHLVPLWKEGGIYYEKALSLIMTSFSKEMGKRVLQSFSHNLQKETLEKAVKNEIGLLGDDYQIREISPNRFLHTRPVGVVTQILPSNNFINGPMAIIHALLTKNALLLKPSQKEPGLLDLFMDSLLKANIDPILIESIALIKLDHKKDHEALQVIKDRSDCLFVWGGDQAIAAFPQDHCHGKVYHFGPKLGIGLVHLNNENDLKQSAKHFAWEIALWEQKACSSPRLIFVKDQETKFASLLEQELAFLEGGHLPTLPLSFDHSAEILLHRERAFFQEGVLIGEEDSFSHSIFVMQEIPSDITSEQRFVYIVPYLDTRDLEKKLTPFKNYLQTATVSLSHSSWDEAIETLLSLGITQIIEAGNGLPGDLGLPHEGHFLMQHLVQHCLINRQKGAFSIAKDLLL